MKKEIKLLLLYIVTAACIIIMMEACGSAKNISVRKYKVDACPSWADNIKNPENEEFVEEVAFNLNKPVSQVTQQEFNNRYLNN
jgi:hypothetical protein